MKKESSIPPDFDWKIYLQLNHDLTKNGLCNQQQAETHYLKHGIDEGRIYRLDHFLDKLPEDFDYRIYGILNPDLGHHFGNDKSKLEMHYRSYGHRENRQFRSSFSYEQIHNLLSLPAQENKSRYENYTVLVNHESSLTGAPMFLQDFANWLYRYNKNLIFVDCVPNEYYDINKNIKRYYHFNDPLKLKNILDNIASINIVYSNSLSPIFKHIDNFTTYLHKTIFHFHECKEDIYRSLKTDEQNRFKNIVDQSYSTIFVAKQIAEDLGVYGHKKVLLCPEFLSHSRSEKILSINKDIKQTKRIQIGMCGTNCSRKNPELFVALSKLNPSYDFIWIGGNIVSDNTPPNLICIEETADPFDHFNNIDYFLLTSKRDPCPIVILENLLMNNKIILLDENIKYKHDIDNLENVTVITDHNNDPKKITKALKKMSLNKIKNQTSKNKNYILDSFTGYPRFKFCNLQKHKNNLLISYYHKNDAEIQYFVNLIHNKLILDQNIENIYLAVSNLDNIDIIAQKFDHEFKERIHILKRENKGFDIGGLLDLIDKFSIPDDEYITYIHNKTNFLWREELYKILYVLDYDKFDTVICKNYCLNCDENDMNTEIFLEHNFMQHLANISFKYISGTCFITQMKNLNDLKNNIEYIKTNLTDINTDDKFWQQCMANKDLFDKCYIDRKNHPIYKKIDQDARDIFLKYQPKNFFELQDRYHKVGIPDYMFDHAIERYIGYLITHNKKIAFI